MIDESSDSDGLPDRKSLRLKGWDYHTPGFYFVTICAKEMASFFGTVVKGRMVLNDAGRMVKQVWDEIPRFYEGVAIDEAVVMPNHFHGVVRLLEKGAPTGGWDRAPTGGCPYEGAVPCGCPLSLPDVVHNFKSLSTTRYIQGVKKANWRAFDGKLWHRNYWDVIVRDEKALSNIRNYIRFNPQNYDTVIQCGAPQFLGNKELLALPKVGFLASRGGPLEHGSLPLSKEDAIISGFLSPLERKVFWAGIKHKKPLIWVKPWSLEEGTDAPAIRSALEEGRLLILSPFAEQEAPSVRRAAWCNEYVLAQCDRLVIGYLNPEGMLACILSEARMDLEIVRLDKGG
jgi:REP element-mobilizing transposase RayT